jgi:hypothetical protein
MSKHYKFADTQINFLGCNSTPGIKYVLLKHAQVRCNSTELGYITRIISCVHNKEILGKANNCKESYDKHNNKEILGKPKSSQEKLQSTLSLPTNFVSHLMFRVGAINFSNGCREEDRRTSFSLCRKLSKKTNAPSVCSALAISLAIWAPHSPRR